MAFRLRDYAGRDDWRSIIVVLNSNKSAQTINIPEDRYTIVCKGGRIDERGLGQMEGKQLTVGGQEAMIIVKK